MIDPTGLSGEKSTIEAQLNVRKMLKERFPRRPWLDVISKGILRLFMFMIHHLSHSLPSKYIITDNSLSYFYSYFVLGDLIEQVPQYIQEKLPAGYLPVSVKTGQIIFF